MSRIDGNVTDFMPRLHSGLAAKQSCSCWICQANLSSHAVFCQDCGAIQPVRGHDHFAVMGLGRRFDIDAKMLDARYTALSRVFFAEIQNARGPRQKQIATDQAEALRVAFTTLRDPVRRAEYLLSLLDAPALTPDLSGDPELHDLAEELATAADATAIDRIAFKAGHGMEVALRDLSGAFRQQSFTEVAVILARLAQFEDIAASARARRNQI